MEKEFIEFREFGGRVPNTANECCNCLFNCAKAYIRNNNELIKNIDKKLRDAVLVDIINYIGEEDIDYRLSTNDFYDDKVREENVEGRIILTIMLKILPHYIFRQDIVESVINNSKMTGIKDKFDSNDGCLVIIDFMNFIAKKYGFERKFTLKELYDRYNEDEYTNQISELNDFLKLTSEYSERINNGENIDNIYNEMLKYYDIKYITEDGKYLLTDEASKKYRSVELNSFWKKMAEENLYAMTYAYVKAKNKYQTNNEIIKMKIKEMKKR